jgi:trehalose 6-phosphate phosphatase
MGSNALDAFQEIGPRVADARHRVIFLDLDGSFAPTSSGDVDAFLWQRLKQLLGSLVSRAGISIAAMSGQDRSDLQARLAIAGITYLGNHGLEISGPGHIFIEPSATAKTDEIKALATLLAARLQEYAGIAIEEKGLSISIQFGQVAPEQLEQVRRTVHGVLAASNHPFHLTTRETTFDIRPRVYWNKGDAVAWVKEQIGHPDALVLYIDDNRSGENPAGTIKDAIVLKVGQHCESSPELELEGPHQVIDFLSWLDKFLQAQEQGLTDERNRYSLV